MSKIQASSDIDNVKPEEVARFVDIFFQEVLRVVNGGLDFQNNFDAVEVSVNFTAANSDTPVTHNLKRGASRYIVTSSSVALVVYNGVTTGTNSTIYLKSSAIGTATILVY